MRCELCSYEFDETQMACHTSCAFNQGCGIICCPNCGYQVADESKSRMARLVRRWIARASGPRPSPDTPLTRPLSALRAGQSALIVAIETHNAARLERLSVFGLVPGSEVTLEQRQPAFVLRIGYTELSIERDLADEIMVRVG